MFLQVRKSLGKPRPVNIKSSPDGEDKTQYSLEWNAESITPIIEFKLQYRKIPDSQVCVFNMTKLKVNKCE